MSTAVKRVFLLCCFASLIMTGCVVVPGRLRTDSRTVGLEGAEAVSVGIEMEAGVLSIDSGSDALMDAEFTYNIARWEPEVEYEVEAGQGELYIWQPATDSSLRLFGETQYEWNLRFNEGIPLDLDVAMGAGQSRLDLSNLNLIVLSVEMRVGECTVDLTGDRENDLAAVIEGGVGELTVLLPQEVGVRVQVSGGLGAVNAPGLQADGDTYVNDAFGESDVTIEIGIQGGIGELNLEVGE